MSVLSKELDITYSMLHSADSQLYCIGYADPFNEGDVLVCGKDLLLLMDEVIEVWGKWWCIKQHHTGRVKGALVSTDGVYAEKRDGL